ncbi:MAG: hypothetical protein ACPGLV_09230, partial [Bacteroidia bacterium]
MYLEGKITIDPAQLTKIEKIKPQKAFKKMLFFLTSGAISDKEEHETFQAVSILQQLNMCFRNQGINNIINTDIIPSMQPYGCIDDTRWMHKRITTD